MLSELRALAPNNTIISQSSSLLFLPLLPSLLREKKRLSPPGPRTLLSMGDYSRGDSVTACDKRLHRLICYLKQTRDHCLHGWIGDTADKLCIMLFSDASFADCTSTSKSTTGIFAALVGPNTFFPLNAVCKKQTVVSHSSTESEIVALDSSLRLEGLPLLSFWEAVTRVTRTCRDKSGCLISLSQLLTTICPALAAKKKRKPSPRKAPLQKGASPTGSRSRGRPPPSPGPPPSRQTISYEDHLLHAELPAPVKVSPPEVKLIVLEDNQAVIKIIQKGRTPALRHLHRTHRIDLDWITETCQSEQIDLKYVGTKEQIADMMTKHFEPKKAPLWNDLLQLALILPTGAPPPETPRTPDPKHPRRDRQPPPARPPPYPPCARPCQVICSGERVGNRPGSRAAETALELRAMRVNTPVHTI